MPLSRGFAPCALAAGLTLLPSGDATIARQRALEVTMAMDPVRTSMACTQARTPDATLDAPNVDSCTTYGVPDERLEQLRSGHGSSDEAFEGHPLGGTEEGSVMALASQALDAIAGYRGRRDPQMTLGPQLMVGASRNPEARQKLVASGLLPNAGEWQRLTTEQPSLAHGLHRFIREWVGYLDPLFQVTFRNTTGTAIEVSSLKYTATPRGARSTASLTAGVETPGHRLELEEGSHLVELAPAIVVPPRASTTTDIVLRLKRASPGVTYDISPVFVASRPNVELPLPTFGITFVAATP